MALVSGRVVTCAGTSGLWVLTNEKAGLARADQSEARDVEITGTSRAQAVPTGHTISDSPCIRKQGKAFKT